MVTEKEKKLTWKYFWKQKGWEIGITLGIIFILLIFPVIIGHISCSISPRLTENWAKIEPNYYPK